MGRMTKEAAGAWLANPVCFKCGQEKPLDEFKMYMTHGRKCRMHTCNDCERLRNAENRRKHPHWHKDWNVQNRDKVHAWAVKRDRKRRMTLIQHYGGDPPRCQCCGESNLGFLTIDHINNDGGKRRAKRHTQQADFQDLILRGFPQEVTVLCYNCHMGRHINGGSCPHKSKQTDSQPTRTVG